MKVGIWNYYEELNYNNYLLFNKDAPIGDDLLLTFNLMYLSGLENDIEFITLDMIKDYNEIDAFIFFDFPKMTTSYVQKAFNAKKPMYLVLFECEVIKKDNWDSKNHDFFEKIFTWNDELIDNKKYFKINFSQKFPTTIKKDISRKEKLCTLISGNKKVNHPLELYSKRIEAIEWFEKHHPTDFEFYGIGWNDYTHANRYVRFLMKKIGISKVLAPNYQTYKGTVKAKKEVLEKYKFAICYENARDIPGYITEKIFDCFFAGCVPIYWGANNITDYIPKECFIDKREFESYERLYDFINCIDDEHYATYLDSIESFLNKKQENYFKSEDFVKQIINGVKI